MTARGVLRILLRARRHSRGGVAIVLASTALLVYEYVAFARRRPTVTELSHRLPWAIPIWAWLVALTVHLARTHRAASSSPALASERPS